MRNPFSRKKDTTTTTAAVPVTAPVAAAKPAVIDGVSEEIRKLPVMIEGAPQHLYDAYLVNIDGATLGDTLPEPFLQALKALSISQRPVRFVSASSSSSTNKIVETLRSFDIEANADQVFLPARLAINYMKRHFPSGRAFIIGDPVFVAELTAGGVSATEDPRETDVVIVAHDHGFSYAKLAIAYEAIVRNDAQLVATSMRYTKLRSDGVREPGVGPIVSAIESATRTRVTRNLGSPAPDLLDEIFADLPADPSRTLLVTDNLSGDVRMAKQYGVPTALILTGEATLEQAKMLKTKDQPNFVISTAAEVVPNYIQRQMQL